jgi:predicted acylesterase/phospholipase RssA
LVIVARDLHEARTRFIKPYKPEYAAMPITTAVLASAAAPTYFPVVEGRFVDGGVGSFGNPCFIAAYEARFCLGWKAEETTLISLGTGKLAPGANGLPLHAPDRFTPLKWISPLLDSFMSDAGDQQARIVDQFFTGLDLRRFQIVTEQIAFDDIAQVVRLIEYGEQFGQMILNDLTDPDLQKPVYRAL